MDKVLRFGFYCIGIGALFTIVWTVSGAMLLLLLEIEKRIEEGNQMVKE